MTASHRVTITDNKTGETREYLVPAVVARSLSADAALGAKLEALGESRSPGRPAGELGIERFAVLFRAPATGRIYWQNDPSTGKQHINICPEHHGPGRGPAVWVGTYPEFPRGAARLHDNGELVVEGEPLVVVCDLGRSA